MLRLSNSNFPPPPLVLQRLGVDPMPHQVHLQKKSYEALIIKFLFLQKVLFNSGRIQVLNEGGFFYGFFCSEQFLQIAAEITQNRSVPWMEKQLLPSWKRNFPEMWKITERNLKGALLCTCKQQAAAEILVTWWDKSCGSRDSWFLNGFIGLR